MDKEKLKKAVRLICILSMFGLYIVFFKEFVGAYLSEDGITRVSVNSFGEGNLEMVTFSLLTVINTITTIQLTKETWENE